MLATTEHHCLGELLVRHAHAELGASIEAVVSNHATLGPLTGQFGIPFHHVPHQGLTREAHEAALHQRLAPYELDYLVLAKYMRILSPAFIGRYTDRIINIHHSFLPAFVGANPYRQAFERGVKIIGATAHYVTEELDAGPIIEQDVARVSHREHAETMVRLGRDIERTVLSRAVKWHLEDRVLVHGYRTVVF